MSASPLLTAAIDWGADGVPASVVGWAIYSSTVRDQKGKRVATPAATERHAEWLDDDGTYYVRVLYDTLDGEQDSQSPDVEITEITLTSLADAPPADPPPATAAAVVDSTLTARVSVDPPTADAATGGTPAPSAVPSTVQVVEAPSGADPSQGKLLAEVPVANSDPRGGDAGRQTSASFPVEGVDASKTLMVRRMSRGGMPGLSPKEMSAVTPPMEDFYPVAIAHVAGATHTGFPAAGPADGWEYDATDGLRLRTVPDAGSITGAWTTILEGQPLGCKYVCRAKVEGDEVDLGATMKFRLSIEDTIHRKTRQGAFATATLDDFAIFPTNPAGTVVDPSFIARECMSDGTPRQPLRECRWEYVIGTTSPVPHGDSDYQPYVPGTWLLGRFVRLRLVLKDPTGWHQIIVPSATALALVPRAITQQSGSPEGALARPPGAFAFDPATGSVYVKGTGVGATGWSPIGGMPAGVMVPFAGPNFVIPAGWLKCDGAKLSTATYAALFAAIGYTWGGAGASFAVPNMPGRYVKGATVDADLTSGGNATHQHVGSTVAVAVTGIPPVAVAGPGAIAAKGNADPGHNHGLAIAADALDPLNVGAYWIIKT